MSKSYCTNCGTQLEKNEKFCTNCGCDLTEQENKAKNKKAFTWIIPLAVLIAAVSIFIFFYPTKTITFKKTFGSDDFDKSNSIILTDDNNYVIAGKTNCTGQRSGAPWLFKVDSEGKKLWSYTYKHNKGNSKEAECAIQAEDGGYILGGKTVVEGNEKAMLIKTDSKGKKEWLRTIDGGRAIYTIMQTNDSNYLVTGLDSSMSHSPWIAKISSDGKKIWSRTFKRHLYFDTERTKDGGYILAGFKSIPTIPLSHEKAFAMKINSKGKKIWSKVFQKGSFSSIEKTKDDNFILAGQTRFIENDTRHTTSKITKISPEGRIIWSKEFESGNINDISVTGKGNFVLAARKNVNEENSAQLIKTTNTGKKTWSQSFEFDRQGSDYASCIKQTKDNGYIITGGAGCTSDYKGDIFLIKTNEKGKIKEK